ncbi:hypothetical protein [Sphingomonas melonis]|uniref:Uncharacterized protein n=1 Tax=Sphingomonas melonis TaxID=152682 RepID=A0A7Y9FL85_9SPHN|nr:hypothetical protein [Sphingomonas melonis]NYD89173.1 hypothetical protein [Sphingomonas melonis]
MDVDVADRPTKPIARGIVVLDPLAEDAPTDRQVVTTDRAICRVALVAAEAGARFQRDGNPRDAMSWMLAPRRVFDGGSAMEACLRRDACERGVLVHGLGLGLDVEREPVDALLADDDDEEFDDAESEYLYGADDGAAGRADRSRSVRSTRLRLYTATLVDTRDNVMVQAFHASMARNIYEVRARLTGRFGPDLAAVADIRPGIHRASPVVVALVSDAVVELIRRMQRDHASPAAPTFAVDIQQCIQA